MKEYCFAGLLAFGLSVIFCFFLIPILKKKKAEQPILSYVKEHRKKVGTPTMGGLAFILASVLSSLCFSGGLSHTYAVTLTVGLAYMAVGFLDDFLKRKHRDNLGLTAPQKIVFQTFVASLAGIYCLRGELTMLNVPFFGAIEIGFWTLPITIFVFLATVNTVNLTDGLDGLAGATCIPFFLVMGVLVALDGEKRLAVLSFALVGALIGYLLFNTSPASVFMGDTGSLALGGFASCIAVFSGNALYVAIVGVMFVLSGISVILQVIYYKLSGGKRIFKMAPLHHHLQKSGYSEPKIAHAYFAITCVCGVLACLARG